MALQTTVKKKTMAMDRCLRFCFINSIFIVYITAASKFVLTYAHLKVSSPLSSVIEVDVGSSAFLPCKVSGEPKPVVSWLKNGHLLSFNTSQDHPVKNQSGLAFYSVLSMDTGNYTCLATNLYDLKEINLQLHVKTPPGKLRNVSIHPSTVVATVRWHVEEDGGYPITNFTLIYRPLKANPSESWHTPQPVHVSPTIRQFFVYQLKPGTDYVFKIWATNKLGPGKAVTVHASTCKPVDPPEIFGKMLADAENFSSTAWLLAVCMMAITVLSLSLLSFALICREQRKKNSEEGLPRIITNPGFEIDLEQSYLLEHADYNDNTEKPFRINNNTVIQPSCV
ncbi:cell adhesion molecule DSCAM [Parasteatoda tepidariorum]|uniref:cell adhesion molecule DSCAM n=1 Tax=Parasteatoda tepidariorum TaxID=114398 RepID=UPI0039BC6DBF